MYGKYEGHITWKDGTAGDVCEFTPRTDGTVTSAVGKMFDGVIFSPASKKWCQPYDIKKQRVWDRIRGFEAGKEYPAAQGEFADADEALRYFISTSDYYMNQDVSLSVYKEMLEECEIYDHAEWVEFLFKARKEYYSK